MRHLYWYITTFLKKHGWVILISFVGAIVIFSLLIPFLINNFNLKQQHYIGLVGEYTLDNLPTEITEQISYGLMIIQEDDNEITPALAENYAISDNGTTYTFTLKDGLSWQDGEPVTVESINYNLPGIQTSREVNHLAFVLTEPFAPFLTRLTDPLIRYEMPHQGFLPAKTKLIGIGDNRLKNYEFKDQSNNKLSQVIVESPTDKWVYRFYLTEEQAVLALKQGLVDEVQHLSHPRDLASWSNMIVTEQNDQDKYLGLFFNLADTRFSNKNIRQAFAYAIEKGQVGQLVLSPISQKSWAYLKGAKRYDKNLDRAIERLTSDIPGEPLDFTLTTNSQNYGRAEEIKIELETLGEQAQAFCQKDPKKFPPESCPNARITVKIDVNNFPDLNNYELLLIGQKIPLDPDQYTLWHSDQAGNFTHYKNTRVDALLETGRQELDHKARTSTYQEFQQVFLEDLPVVFLEYLTNFDIQRQ